MSEQVLLRPENPHSESIARVSFDGGTLRVYYPERRDTFRKVVRRLRFGWHAPYWSRQIDKEAALPQRAAELVRDLLAAGFCVKAPADIAHVAIGGKFEEEPRRTIGATSQRYPGWFSLWWAREEDCYRVAMKLPGAKWEGSFVVVPPENYEAVADFAAIHGFKMNKAALAIVAAAKEEREAAIVVRVEGRGETAVSPSANIPKLAVPETVAIDDELADEPL